MICDLFFNSFLIWLHYTSDITESHRLYLINYIYAIERLGSLKITHSRIIQNSCAWDWWSPRKARMSSCYTPSKKLIINSGFFLYHFPSVFKQTLVCHQSPLQLEKLFLICFLSRYSQWRGKIFLYLPIPYFLMNQKFSPPFFQSINDNSNVQVYRFMISSKTPSSLSTIFNCPKLIDNYQLYISQKLWYTW